MYEKDIIEKENDERKEIFSVYKNELFKRELSNTENYDKSILTLSSAGLAVSFTYLKFFIPVISEAKYLFLVKFSWGLFLISIILSLIAYQISNRAIARQVVIAENYYIHRNDSALDESNRWAKTNSWLNIFVGLFFIAAITTFVVFAIQNLNK